MPDLKFTCSGVITGFLLGVDIRTDGNRTLYPRIQLFTTESNSNNYSLVVGSERDIELNAARFQHQWID